jgi:hypothetical protein
LGRPAPPAGGLAPFPLTVSRGGRREIGQVEDGSVMVQREMEKPGCRDKW